MKKCDFCEKSNPNGKCFWSSQSARESDCKKAIKRMMEVLEKGNKKMNNKYQEALNTLTDWFHSYKNEKGVTIHERHITPEYKKAKKIIQELVDKETPKKLKSKTDKDGRLLWICPNCGDVYMKFWSDVETITCRKYCDECGQKLDWSEKDGNNN